MARPILSLCQRARTCSAFESLAALEGTWATQLLPNVDVAGLDVFGTSNFFNFMAWAAALEYLLKLGVAEIYKHDQQLVTRLIEGLAETALRISSPLMPPTRSSIVVIEHPRARDAAAALRAEGIDVAIRQGRVRISPHVHNTTDDIDRVVAVLTQWLARA